VRLKALATLENFQNDPPALVRLALMHPVLVDVFLVNLPSTRHARIEFDFAEGGFVAVDVLLQQSEQRLGLLRAQVDALKITDLHLSFTLLLNRAKDEEKVPDIHSHLHAVGIGFPVIGSIGQLDIGLRRNAHSQAV
jgi:hypothetical protein